MYIVGYKEGIHLDTGERKVEESDLHKFKEFKEDNQEEGKTANYKSDLTLTQVKSKSHGNETVKDIIKPDIDIPTDDETIVSGDYQTVTNLDHYYLALSVCVLVIVIIILIVTILVILYKNYQEQKRNYQKPPDSHHQIVTHPSQEVHPLYSTHYNSTTITYPYKYPTNYNINYQKQSYLG